MTTQHLSKSMVINENADSIYQIWKDIKKFPKFMKHIRSVERKQDDIIHWMVEGPFDTMIEWDTKIYTDPQERKITWKGTGGDIDASGQVQVKPEGPEKTKLKLFLNFEPKTGLASSIFQSLFGNPERHVDYSLQKFKEYAEKQGD